MGKPQKWPSPYTCTKEMWQKINFKFKRFKQLEWPLYNCHGFYVSRLNPIKNKKTIILKSDILIEFELIAFQMGNDAMDRSDIPWPPSLYWGLCCHRYQVQQPLGDRHLTGICSHWMRRWNLSLAVHRVSFPGQSLLMVKIDSILCHVTRHQR